MKLSDVQDKPQFILDVFYYFERNWGRDWSSDDYFDLIEKEAEILKKRYEELRGTTSFDVAAATAKKEFLLRVFSYMKENNEI